MATHSSILAWRIPWTEKPGRLYCPWGCRESHTTECLALHFIAPPGIVPSPGRPIISLHVSLLSEVIKRLGSKAIKGAVCGVHWAGVLY